MESRNHSIEENLTTRHTYRPSKPLSGSRLKVSFDLLSLSVCSLICMHVCSLVIQTDKDLIFVGVLLSVNTRAIWEIKVEVMQTRETQ